MSILRRWLRPAALATVLAAAAVAGSGRTPTGEAKGGGEAGAATRRPVS
jgi:hypothetical protein